MRNNPKLLPFQGKDLLMLLLFLSPLYLIAQITISPNRLDATYSKGETIYFQVNSPNSGSANYEIFYDERTAPLASGTINLQSGASQGIPFTLYEPGVLLCKITQNGQTALAAATVSAFELAALENEPADFDAFWQNAKAQLASIPINAQESSLGNNAYSKSYRVNLASIEGRRVYGYLTVPNGTGPFPAVVSLPAFGGGSNLVGKGADLAEQSGVIHFSISIHNAELDQTDPNAYQPDNLDDRNRMYFKYAALAGVRAIDYLYTRNDFDKQNIGLAGVSQGGGLAVMVAGIDNRVKLIVNSNPTHSQHLGIKYGRASGFPNYLSENASFQQQQTVKYFDNIYFAKRFKGVSWTLISYQDLVCPAATTFATFNQLEGERILTHSLLLGHSHPAEYWNGRHAFFRRHFSTAKPSKPGVSTETGYSIDAGNTQNISTGASATLSARVEMNAQVNPNYRLSWAKISGAGQVNFSNAQSYNTTATFSQAGTYRLRFTAKDEGQLSQDAQFFTLMDDVTIIVGNCTDNDNDGFCMEQDCNDYNAAIPATPGSSCDDYNPNTQNDQIQADGCSCAGTTTSNCTDNDRDGICAENDCDDRNASIPAAQGTPCNDGKSNTLNDVIQADGCTCLGTTSGSGNPNVCEVVISTGNGAITVTGMDEPNFKLTILDNNWSQELYKCSWNDCPSSKTLTNLEAGEYVVKVQSFNDSWGKVCDFFDYVTVSNTSNNCTDNDGDGICAENDCNDFSALVPAAPGSPCDDQNPNTHKDVIQPDQCSCYGVPITSCTDNDGDGICAENDCNDFSALVPAAPGSPCDDQNPNTHNDIIQPDRCSCYGVPKTTCTDNDGDGICIENDCNDFSALVPATPGSPCDDQNPNTHNDVIQPDQCSCAGMPINANASTPNCNAIYIDGSYKKLKIHGLTAPIEIIRVRNENWQELFKCVGDCNDPQIIPNLAAGLYRIQVQMYTENWNQICDLERTVEVRNGAASRENFNTSKKRIGLFPNPAKETVLINLADYEGTEIQLQISDQFGKVMFKKDKLLVKNGAEIIDLQQFTNGLYFVQIRTKGESLVGEKLVVSRLY